MKNNKVFLQAILSVVLILTIASCKKWVDYNPHEDFKQTELDYLKSESDYRTMVVSVYTPLQWLNQAIVVSEIASDNAVAGGESASDILSLQQIDDMTHNANNSTLTELWQAAYEGINRANYLHQYKQENPGGQSVSFLGKEALYGEVYFLRAYYYFHLVKFFGDVPLFADSRLGLTQSKTLKRTERAKVYAQIESDLLAAIGVLPSVQLEKGRVTKYAAQALLGKVYLYQKKYTEAASVLENVVNSAAFSLSSNYAKIFLAQNENGSESVFEIQYSNATPYFNWNAVTRGQGNYAAQQCGVRGINGSDSMPYAAGWSTNLPTTDLASIYENGDQRKQVTILDIEAYKKAHPSYNITYQVAPYKNTGLYNQKYLPRKGETSGQVELNYANNYRIIRYADVLLMAAEANVGGGGSEVKAQEYLNQVRRRAFGDNSHDITATGNNLYVAILNERRLELAMEGDRFFDLVRTGQAEAKITGFVKFKNEVFPIPIEEINVSGLSQNSGY